ncbi:hypothetical protein DM877_18260 [Enterobacter cloacae]|uniref:Restriction endonuclease type IV Mrr domain-containing protein n=1 Tax=Enterobacter cloacae TaxID=550 RepID=A0A4Q2E5J7_ENTCL|nr:hypothetical protein DM877_18260 [Enterobacter cloacae]
MDASHFELLIADLFRHLQGTGVDWNWYDDVCRVNDGADNGVDVLLSLDQESRGIVQCKRYSSADVTMTLVRQELLALTLRGLVIDDLLPPEDHSTPFRYILAVSNNVAADVFSFFTKKMLWLKISRITKVSGKRRPESLRANMPFLKTALCLPVKPMPSFWRW